MVSAVRGSRAMVRAARGSRGHGQRGGTREESMARFDASLESLAFDTRRALAFGPLPQAACERTYAV